MPQKLWRALIGASLLLAGCRTASTPIPDSGVEGYVTIGPTCPVVRVDQPCPDQPYQASLSILNTEGQTILTVRTTPDGFFHIPLPPGEYRLHPLTSGIFPSTRETPFAVEVGRFTRLDVQYDSGIR